jgi:hypothetical protein
MTNATTVTIDFATATTDDIAAAYVAATPSEKSAMRTAATDAITAAVVAGDVEAAQRCVAARDAMVAAKSTTPVVDYAARIADHRATLVAAITAIDGGNYTLPDGVSCDVSTVDFAAGVAGDVSRFVAVSGRKSGRGNVADYIAATLGDTPMTIAGLRAGWVSSDDYPTAPPSSGAIGACLLRDDDDRFDAVDVDGKAGAVAV